MRLNRPGIAVDFVIESEDKAPGAKKLTPVTVKAGERAESRFSRPGCLTRNAACAIIHQRGFTGLPVRHIAQEPSEAAAHAAAESGGCDDGTEPGFS